MTETRFTWRWLVVLALLGIGMGLVVGLAAGWLIFPNIGGSNVAGLSATAQNDYIVLVANTFAYDQDAPRAKQRLAQLQDPDIKTRVERLAKALASRKDPAAANVADLAITLGSDDSSLQVMAQTVSNVNPADSNDGEPTKIARTDNGNEAPTVDEAGQEPTTGADEPTAEPTAKKKKTKVPTAETTATTAPVEPTQVPATKRPAPPPPTAAPTALPPAPALSPEFKPGFPGGWYSTTSFVPANVAPGQKYWRLKTAIFCDRPGPGRNPTEDTCPGFPGGENDHTIYVAALDENGNCAEVTAKNYTNLGETFDMERKTAIYPWTSCNIDYEKNMNGEGNDVWIDSAGLQSDRMNGMVMNSPQLNWSENRVHVRYFLIFQRTTR